MLLFYIILFCISGIYPASNNHQLEQIEIDDAIVLEVLKQFTEKHDFFNDPQNKLFLLLRFEANNSNKVIYVSSGQLISYFESNIPDAFAIVESRLVFIYNDQDSLENQISFEEFYNQFSFSIRNNVLPNGELNPNEDIVSFLNPECWRVILKKNKILDIKKVYSFPSKSFCKDYKYDENGHVIYHDGIYAASQIPPEPPYGFSFVNYLESNTSLIINDNLDITLVFVIDENGKATDVQIEGLDDQILEKQIIAALKNMPRWTPGKIDGKSVNVRDSYGLKEF